MKRFLLNITAFLLLSNSIFALDVQKIDQEKIESSKIELIKQIRNHNLVRYALVGTVAAGVGVYKAYNYFYPDTLQATSTDALTSDEILFLKKMVASAQAVGETYMERFKNFASTSLYQSLLSMPYLVAMPIANWFTSSINLKKILEASNFEFLLFNIKLACGLIDSQSAIVNDVLNMQVDSKELASLKVALKAELVDGALSNDKKEVVYKQLEFLSNKLADNLHKLLAYLKMKEENLRESGKNVDNFAQEIAQLITSSNELIIHVHNSKNDHDKLFARALKYSFHFEKHLKTIQEFIK